MKTASAYKSLCQEEKQFLSDMAEEVAMLVAKPEKRHHFCENLIEFREKWEAYKTAYDARRKGKWQPSMGTPDDPLATIWPRSDGRPLSGGAFRFPYCGGAIRGVLGAYALLAVIHDKVLPNCPTITTGTLPKELADEIWRDLVTGANNEDQLIGTPKWVIPTGKIEAFLRNVNDDIESHLAPKQRTDQKPPASVTAAGGKAQDGDGGRASKIFAPGKRSQAWQELRRIVGSASRSVWIEDAWLGSDVVALFGEDLPDGVALRVLGPDEARSNRSWKGALAFLKRLGDDLAGRLEVRCSADVHDRYLYVDGRVWRSTESFKDMAKKRTTKLEPRLEDASDLVGDFERRWAEATKVYPT